MKKNLYEILEIPIFSDVEIAKEAYRKLSRKYHPDNFINAEEKVKKESLNKQQLINMAWDILSNKEKKYEYDLKLKKGEYYYNSEFQSSGMNSFENDIFEFFNNYAQNIQKDRKLNQLIREYNKLEIKIKKRKDEIKKEVTRSNEYIELEKKEQLLMREEMNLKCSMWPIEEKLYFKQKQEIDIKNKFLYRIFPKIYTRTINKIEHEQQQIQLELDQINLQINQINNEKIKVTNEVYGGYVKKFENKDKELIELINLSKELELQIESLKEEKNKTRR